MPFATELVWDLRTEAPELVAQIPGGDATLAPLTQPLDPPPSVAPFRDEQRVRPHGHQRAYYQRIDGGGVVAWKGTEPTCADFPAWVAQMATQQVQVEVTLGSPVRDVLTTRAELRAIDKWPLVEGKIPGAYTVREGVAEARAAVAFQRAHLARYGTLARVPLPLVVVRWPAPIQAATRAALAPHLAPAARELVDGAVLGAYAYAYPTVPYRLYHLSVRDAQAGFGYRARLASFPPQIQPRLVVERWLELVARMLASGFVPKDPAAVMTGDCLQPQNVTIDGGVADVGSVVASRELGDRALADAVRRSVAELTASITRLLLGPTAQLRDRFPDLYAHVWRTLAEQVAADTLVDERIGALLRPASAWAALDHLFALVLP